MFSPQPPKKTAKKESAIIGPSKKEGQRSNSVSGRVVKFDVVKVKSPAGSVRFSMSSILSVGRYKLFVTATFTTETT